MPLCAVEGTIGAGGAVFSKSRNQSPANPGALGRRFLLVGDTAICKLHKKPTPSVILNGDPHTKVQGVPVAYIGSQTSCGHPLVVYPLPWSLLLGAGLLIAGTTSKDSGAEDDDVYDGPDSDINNAVFDDDEQVVDPLPVSVIQG